MSLEAILQEYNENNKPTSGSSGGKFDLSKYFSTFLPDGVNEAIKTIRLLPGKDGATPFTTIHIHTKKVGQSWKKFVCPKHEKNEDCPFCEAYDLLNSSKDEAQRKTAYEYKARKAYVMKLIDRENESEGPKFWRVNHNSKKNGYYDSIISLFKLYAADLSDPKTGRDLAISIERNEKNFPVVTNIIARDVSPLSTDEGKLTTWVNDAETWENVYAVKPYEFLKIIVLNGEPVWDGTTKTFVDKNADPTEVKPAQNFNGDLEQELTMGGEQAKPTQEAAKPVEPTTTAQPAQTTPPATQQPTQAAPQVEEDDDDDDLPF